MYKNLLSGEDQAPARSFQFGEALWQLPLQYINVFIKPSVNTLREATERASWWLVLVQFLSLVIITVTVSFLGLVIPSTALHGITALTVSFVRSLGWLPFPLNEITFVLASFIIGLGTAYVGSKVCGGQGTFLAHLYCLLLCTVPLVIVSGALLLLPATGGLLLLIGSIVCALFIYRMLLHAIAIMAIHHLEVGQATMIVLILPLVVLAAILIIGLLFCSDGAFLDVFDPFVFVENSRGRDKASDDSHDEVE